MSSEALSEPEPFRVAAVVPTFNNPNTVAGVCHALLEDVETVILVDDGSSEPAKGVIDQLAEDQRVVLVRRQENGGKGAAVKDGLKRAAALGYSHALQVDADGQHSLVDAKRFVEAARAEPSALILGAPVFDESVPKGRLHARKLTIFWTTIETFGRKVIDPMCGFRVYPLRVAAKLRVSGNFMDFDPEIAVRMVWAGVKVVNLETRVRYISKEDGGVSHFRMFRDNVRITWMHTRLVIEGILRLLFQPLKRLMERSAL